jgi:hypothetical protein
MKISEIIQESKTQNDVKHKKQAIPMDEKISYGPDGKPSSGVGFHQQFATQAPTRIPKAEVRNADGLTQKEWINKIVADGGRIVGQAKMINGPVIASLNGKKVTWKPADSQPSQKPKRPDIVNSQGLTSKEWLAQVRKKDPEAEIYMQARGLLGPITVRLSNGKKVEWKGEWPEETRKGGSSTSVAETATAGATSSANVGTVVSPHVAIGRDRGSKSYTGSPGRSGTKAPNLPKIKQPKKKDGTAINALDMKTSLFGEGNFVKR